jgi:hypothetical protein
MAAPAQLSESESALVLQLGRFIEAHPREARQAAARLARRLSDRAAWGREIARYRETARGIRGMGNLTPAQRRAMCRDYRPTKDDFFNAHTVSLRPYWRLEGEAARLLLDAAEETGDITRTDAWDTILMLHILMCPDLDAGGLGLESVAEWRRKDGWGRLRVARPGGLSVATKRSEAFSRARGALAKLSDSASRARNQRDNQPASVEPALAIDDWSATRPPPVHEAIQMFAGLYTRSGKVLRAWDALHAVQIPKYAVPATDDDLELFQELPDEIATYTELGRHKAERRKVVSDTVPRCLSVRPWLRWLEARDDMTLAVRMWRLSLDHTRVSLPTVSPWMDDLSKPPVQRWTADVQGELNRFGGLIDRMVTGDTPEGFDRSEFDRLGVTIAGRLSELKRVPNVPASSVGRERPGGGNRDDQNGAPPPIENTGGTRPAPDAGEAAAKAHPENAPLRGRGSRREDLEPNWREVPGSGMTWQLARKKAEYYVKRHGWPGRNVLAQHLGCSTPTLDKAVRNSPFLKARQAEANKPAARSVRAKRSGSTPHRDLRAADPVAAAGIVTDDLFARLVDAAEPAEQAELRAMPPEKLAELLLTIGEDPGAVSSLSRSKRFR